MVFMNWSRHFVTGIEIVDREHRGLVDLINGVPPLLASSEPVSGEDVETLLDDLDRYARTHFRDEERLMSEAGMDANGIEHQVHAHRAYVDELAAMRREIGANGQLDGRLLLRFLANWLSFHMLADDQLMARQLALIASGHTPAEAATQVREAKEDTAQAVLADALIDLYGVVSARNRALLQSNEQLQAARNALADLNTRLEEQIEQRTRELSQTNAELLREQAELHQAMEAVERTQSQLLQSEKMAAVGQLAAGVAHEINNPIGFVNSNLATLGEYIEDTFAVLDVYAAAEPLIARDPQAIARLRTAKAEREIAFIREDVKSLLAESLEGLTRVKNIVQDLKTFPD